MRRATRVVVWLLVILLVTGQPIGLVAADYFGQVTFNGVPVPGVTVTAVQGDPSTSLGTGPSTALGPSRKAVATTDQDGIYRLADLADGLWNLTIEMLGFATITRVIKVPDEQ